MKCIMKVLYHKECGKEREKMFDFPNIEISFRYFLFVDFKL